MKLSDLEEEGMVANIGLCRDLVSSYDGIPYESTARRNSDQESSRASDEKGCPSAGGGESVFRSIVPCQPQITMRIYSKRWGASAIDRACGHETPDWQLRQKLVDWERGVKEGGAMNAGMKEGGFGNRQDCQLNGLSVSACRGQLMPRTTEEYLYDRTE